MDTTSPTHLSLCSGYGGLDLGLKRVVPNLRTVAYAEIEAFACELLLARMESGALDAAPIWSNLKSFPWAAFSGRVDILSGGYPCQPFSAAGKRLGTDDERHLWPYIADGIRILRPRVCFFENVEGHITLGLREVVDELGAMGYRSTWGLFSAAEVGAPHQRKRVFVMAHLCDEGLQGREWFWQAGTQGASDGHAAECGCSVWPSRPGEPQHGWEPPRVVANAEQRQTEPEVGGDADGPADWMDYAELCYASDNRTDELRMLGNGVVPATAARAFQTLMRELTK